MSGQTPESGYVLTASDSSGDTTWTSSSGVSGWTQSGTNTTTTDNVGIGTTSPQYPLDVSGAINGFDIVPIAVRSLPGMDP